MKYDLMIRDATAEEIAPLLRLLGGGAYAAASIATAAPVNGDDAEEASAPTSTANVDSSGRPYDANIHSEKRGVKSDGTWRLRRGVSKDAVAAADIQWNAIKAAHGAPVGIQGMPAGIPQPPPFNPAPPPVMPPLLTGAPMPPPGWQPPQPAPTFTMPPGYQQPQPATSLDFNGFMQHIAQKTQQRDANGIPLINGDYLASLTQRIGQATGVGLSAITDLMSRTDLIPKAIEIIAADGRW